MRPKIFCLSIWEAAIALTVNVEEILGEADFAGEIRSLVSHIKFDVTIRPAVGWAKQTTKYTHPEIRREAWAKKIYVDHQHSDDI